MSALRCPRFYGLEVEVPLKGEGKLDGLLTPKDGSDPRPFGAATGGRLIVPADARVGDGVRFTYRGLPDGTGAASFAGVVKAFTATEFVVETPAAAPAEKKEPPKK